MIGRIVEASKWFSHPEWLDISEDVVFDGVTFPKLFSTIRNKNWGNVSLEQEVPNPVPGAGDYFGASVDIYENTMVVGAYFDGPNAGGSVHVYNRIGSTWSKEQSIDNPNPDNLDKFGISVAVYQDTIVVGAPGADEGGADQGSAYVYARSGSVWSLEQRIDNPDTNTDTFAEVVDIYANSIIIGNYGKEVSGSTIAGGAYIYKRTGTAWALEQTINNPTPAVNDRFGRTVAINKDTCVIGATGHLGSTDGEVHIYARSGTTWSSEQIIYNPDALLGGAIGFTIDVNNNSLAIGLSSYDVGAESSAGCVYVYTRSGTTWTLEQQIINPTPLFSDFFGSFVRVYEDTVVIGAYGEDTGASSAGSVYVYSRSNTTWSLAKTINNPSPVDSDYFGESFSIFNDTIIVGMKEENSTLSNSGAFYSYRIPLDSTNVIYSRQTGNTDTSYFIKAK